MLALMLAVLSHAPGWSRSMSCRDGGAVRANVATDALQTPGGATVALGVSSADDHTKGTHGCGAAYALSVTPHAGAAAVSIDLLHTSAGWGRRLMVQLDGVGGDGTRILGLLHEDGREAFTALVESDGAGDRVHVLLLPRGFGAQAGCAGRVRIVATSGGGAVLGCRRATRWLVLAAPGGLPKHLWGPDMEWGGDLSVGTVRRLRVGEAVAPLRSMDAAVAPER